MVQNKENMIKKICPNCKSKDIVKRGSRITQNRGKVQRFFCKDCGYRFITDPFTRMRNNPQKITCALDLFCRGLSTRGVQEHFKAFFQHNSDHSTILRWIRKFSLKIASYTDNLKVNTGSYIEVDEMEFHRRKSHKKKLGVDTNWFIDGIDVKTRFMINSAYFKSRSTNNIKKVLLNIKEKSGEQIKIVTTDGFNAYEKQKGICPKCKKHFEIDEMEADHIKPWHEGGKTIAENCQMLCKQDNRTKSGK